MMDSFKKMLEDKKEYRQMMARAQQLPDDYQFVFRKMQDYLWQQAASAGMDVLKIQYDAIERFEDGAARGKEVLQVTGPDVAAFCDGLLRDARTYAADQRDTLNREIRQKLGGK